MIIDVSVENFLSFNNKVTLSLIANNTKGLENNYVKIDDKKIFKTAAIYGANASGKSNLFKIINLVAYMIQSSSDRDLNSKLSVVPNELNASDSFSSFEINFIKDGIRYYYGFKANKDHIAEEFLYYYPNGRITTIFKRSNENYTFSKDNKLLNELKERNTPNKFFLSTATIWNYQKTKPAYDFLTKDIEVSFEIEEMRNRAFEIYYNDFGDLKAFALDFLKKADLDIVDFETDVVDIPEYILSSIPDSLKELTNSKAYHTKFKHKANDKEYYLDFGVESNGTQVLFTLLPFIYNAIKNNGVLLIDELDKSLHPFLVEYIVNIFNDSDINKTNAQLIFNTHDTNLLDLNVLRRDQIWLTEKNYENGSSELYSLGDFSLRNKENIERGYLLGRYGGVPYIQKEINLWEGK